jgi:hypothetical protein
MQKLRQDLQDEPDGLQPRQQSPNSEARLLKQIRFSILYILFILSNPSFLTAWFLLIRNHSIQPQDGRRLTQMRADQDPEGNKQAQSPNGGRTPGGCNALK